VGLVRPAALLLTLSGAACSDDGSTDTANDSVPPMVADEGPMPNPTTSADATDTVAPMIPPTTGDLPTTGGSTTIIPPMPPPADSSTGTGTGTSSGSGSDTAGSTTVIPPMPPPTGGALPGDEPE